MSNRKDVFISYRRDGGATVARMFAELLKIRGITVFFDAKNLGQGDFTQQIEAYLEEAETVLLVVTPNMFERCKNGNDWIRKEIEYAFENKKPIIPLFVNGVNGFPNDLPSSIMNISNQNGILFSHDNFDDAMEKLINQIKSRKDLMFNVWKSIIVKKQNFNDVTTLLEDHHDFFKRRSPEWRNMVNLVAEQFIADMKRQKFKNITSVQKIFKHYPLSLLRKLCENLNIDFRGSRNALGRSLMAYIRNDELYRPSGDGDYDYDYDNRLDAFSDSVATVFGNDKTTLKKLLEENFDKDDDWSNKKIKVRDIIDFALEYNSPEKILNIFTEKMVKEISWKLLEDDKGRKGELINRISKYIDYES